MIKHTVHTVDVVVASHCMVLYSIIIYPLVWHSIVLNHNVVFSYLLYCIQWQWFANYFAPRHRYKYFFFSFFAARNYINVQSTHLIFNDIFFF